MLAALGQGLRAEFPNPDRIGCPGREIIAAVATHRMPLSQAERYLDHLGSCGACYRNFLQLQAEYGKLRARTVFAVAASVLIVADLATWAMLHQHDQQIPHIVVDLRGRAVARDTEPPATEPPLEISRSGSVWEVYLPIGSSEGLYDLGVTAADGQTLFAGSADAAIADGATSLRANVDLSGARPRVYHLEVRKHGSEWTSYPIRIN